MAPSLRQIGCAAALACLCTLACVPARAQAPATPDCNALTDQAMAADLQAATAPSRNEDLQAQARLVDSVVGLWSQAVAACSGRAAERAQRNLADSQRTQAGLAERLGAGPQCATGQRDAGTLQDLARQALGERRWHDAAGLFRKAESQWELAAERCTGAQQDMAQRRRSQSEIDGHNAEHCAPVFEQAREHTQRLRGLDAAAREEREAASQVAETLWRDAVGRCKGQVVDLARGNAQALARERGTAWVARAPAAPGPQGAAPTAASSRPATALATSAALGVVPTPTSAAAAPVATTPPTGPRPQPAEFTAEGTRFSGQFVQDADGQSYSGTGQLAWANGDRFEGTLVRGRRQGQGEMVWANGQRFRGDWADDQPHGQGRLRFANGDVYEGRIQRGQPDAQGSMRYASGDSYTGELREGRPHGRGAYTWKNGQRFEGQWTEGRPQGAGLLVFANGNRYEGTIVNGLPQGRGVLVFVGGNRYDGEIDAGLPHGSGRMVFASGDVYEGRFQRGEPDGEGTYTWIHGDVYEGQWRAGRKHGLGAFTWKSGERREGRYENDEPVEAAAQAAK